MLLSANLSVAVGTGSLSGWTKRDFLDEIKIQREIVCNRNSFGADRLDAIAKATSLTLMCADDNFCEQSLNPIIEEMKARDRMLLDMTFKKLFNCK